MRPLDGPKMKKKLLLAYVLAPRSQINPKFLVMQPAEYRRTGSYNCLKGHVVPILYSRHDVALICRPTLSSPSFRNHINISAAAK